MAGGAESEGKRMNIDDVYKHYRHYKKYSKMGDAELDEAARIYAEGCVAFQQEQRDRVQITPRELIDDFLQPKLDWAIEQEKGQFKSYVKMRVFPPQQGKSKTDLRVEAELSRKVLMLERCIRFLETIAEPSDSEVPK